MTKTPPVVPSGTWSRPADKRWLVFYPDRQDASPFVFGIHEEPYGATRPASYTSTWMSPTLVLAELKFKAASEALYEAQRAHPGAVFVPLSVVFDAWCKHAATDGAGSR